MAYNYKIVVAYDGAKYQGWQKNKNAKETIQNKLERAISEVVEEEVTVVGSGRTDKGVHAEGQVANFVTNNRQKSSSLVYQINKVLPEDIVIRSVQKVDIDFNSRFAAHDKTYRYTIWKANAVTLPLFERKYVYHIDEKVDVDLMLLAAQKFVGEHDFKGFSSDKTKKSTTRTIHSLDIIEEEDFVEVIINGNGFLYNMVRIIVGTLIEIGKGVRHDGTIDAIFEEKIREKAGYTAPAKGLCLTDVNYKD